MQNPFPIEDQSPETAFDLSKQTHPLAEFVGMFKDDPLIEKWKKSIKSHRKERDIDADKP
jgi:hypothetical protein